MYRLGQKPNEAMATAPEAMAGLNRHPTQTDMRLSVSKRHTIASSINGETQNVFTKEHLNISRA